MLDIYEDLDFWRSKTFFFLCNDFMKIEQVQGV